MTPDCQGCIALRAQLATALKRATDAEAERDQWMWTSHFHLRNEQFYRGLVIQIGEPFGVAAKTQDDGGIVEDVLCLKVPELVEELRLERDRLEAENKRLREALNELREAFISGDVERENDALVAAREALAAPPVEAQGKAWLSEACTCSSLPTPNADSRCSCCGGSLVGRVTTQTLLHRSGESRKAAPPAQDKEKE